MNIFIYNILAVFFAICIIQETSMAQTSILGNSSSTITSNLFNYQKFSEPKAVSDLGTYYYDSAWQNGSIYMLDSSIASGLTLRYDVLSRHVEIMEKNRYNTVGVIKSRLITGFSLGEDGVTEPAVFVKSNWKNKDGQQEKGFIKVIKSEGDFTLYKNMEAVMQKSNYIPQVGMQPNKWIIEESLIIGLNGVQYILPNRKSKAIELFQEHASIDIEPYLKKHKLNTKKEEDILVLIQLLEKG